jgi:uncharacterized paraquat-inducible protein A
VWRRVSISLLVVGFTAFFGLSVYTPAGGRSSDAYILTAIGIVAAGLLIGLVAAVLYLPQESQRKYYKSGLQTLALGNCHTCKYPATGHDKAVCPECGSDIPAFIREARWALRQESDATIDELVRRG